MSYETRHNWTNPRPMDGFERMRRHGPVQPMYEPNWWERLTGRLRR